MRKLAVLTIALLPCLAVPGAHAEDAKTGMPVAVANIRAAIGRWRSAPAFRAQVKYKISILSSVLSGRSRGDKGARGPSLGSGPDGRLNLSATMTFLVAGRKYRFSQEYTDFKALPRMADLAVEAAYDGKQFQFFWRRASVMQYSKDESVPLLNWFVPSPQLQPFQFLCAGTAGSRRSDDAVQWPQLFDDKLIRERLSSGVVGSARGKSGQRPTVTFRGGKWEGDAVAYRVYVDGPGGQPSEIDYVDSRGIAVADEKFEYAVPDGGTSPIPVRMALNCHPAGEKVVYSMTAETRKIEIAPALAEDAFTIDFTSANIVEDIDAKKTLAGRDPHRPAAPPQTGMQAR